MKSKASVLVVGDYNAHMSTLAERVRDLGHSILRLKTLEEAIDVATERKVEFDAALIEVPSLAFNLRDALAAFRERTNSFEMRCIATGCEPEHADREGLREAGIGMALWSPVDDTALRFQLNAALAPAQVELLRSEVRAPFETRATIRAGGRVKVASIYSLSAGGAYLETPRPSMSGAQIDVRFHLPHCEISATGRVLYTNVPGNLTKGMLPMGMAVRFDGLGSDASGSIRETVESRAAALSV